MNGRNGDREGFAALLLRMRAAGINDQELFSAIEATPRRSFVPVEWQGAVWQNRMVPIECGETLEGIDTQVRALAALGISPGQRVLEIGTGSGFTAAAMARLAGKVLTLERFRTLAEQARQRFSTLGLTNVVVRQADGAEGAAGEGPFDRVIAWAAYENMPRQFVDQLSTGGVMVAPIGPAEEVQALVRLTKVGSRFERQDIARVRLQPLAQGVAVAI